MPQVLQRSIKPTFDAPIRYTGLISEEAYTVQRGNHHLESAALEDNFLVSPCRPSDLFRVEFGCSLSFQVPPPMLYSEQKL